MLLLLSQTLLVMWVKASVNGSVSDELWDELLTVLASLTEWTELVAEWTVRPSFSDCFFNTCDINLIHNFYVINYVVEKEWAEIENERNSVGKNEDYNEAISISHNATGLIILVRSFHSYLSACKWRARGDQEESG